MDKDKIYEEEKARAEAKEKIEADKKKKGCIGCLVVFIIIAIIGFIADSCSGDKSNNVNQPTTTASQTNTATTNSSPQQEPKDDGFIKSGMYKIGKDIPAGEYLIFTEGTAYYQLTKDSTGTLESIITNDNFSGTRYLTVSEGQYLQLRNSKMISAAKADPQKPTGNEYLEGMYKVGKDLPAGEYKVVSSGGSAYIEVAANSKGILESIVSNDNFEGEKYISVKDGQYIKLNGCNLIK